MFSDTLFRIVNTAGGLGLDDELWRRQVLGPAPARVTTGAIRRRIEAALMQGEPTAPDAETVLVGPAECRTPA